jgi:hypothetical protein
MSQANMRRGSYNLVAIGLAQALNECRTEPVAGVVQAIDAMCEVLANDNRNFDPVLMIETIELYTLIPVLDRASDKLNKLKDKYSREVVEVGVF